MNTSAVPSNQGFVKNLKQALTAYPDSWKGFETIVRRFFDDVRDLRQNLAVRLPAGAGRSSPAVPPGVRVYAVGDIHGRADLLAGLHQRIRDHAQAHPGPRNVVVYLGDYCDRGLNSRDVIDILLNHPLPGFESIHLRGNHDQEFLDFLVRPEAGRRWLRHGGDATLYSYGVEVPPSRPSLDLLQAAQAELRQKVPLRHVRFLEGLRLHHQAGDYFFVHAGINPEKEWSMQTPEDYLWIREEFLDSNAKFDKVVIHGHSAGSRPEVRSNRIGVDTGACYTNVLTCVVLEGVNRSFLSTRSAPTR